MATSHFEQMDELKETIPDEYHDTFEQLTGQGSAPSTVAAAIDYMTNPDRTQKEVAREYDITPISVRSSLSAVCALEGINRSKITTSRSPTSKNRIEYVEEIADVMDWEPGEDYTKSDNHQQDGQLYKRAIIDLHERLCDND